MSRPLLDALHLFEWAEKILALDAVQAGGPPGTVYSFGVADVDDAGVKASLHELNLLATLRFLKEKDKPEIVILGVEPQTIDYGLDLTPPVAAALPRLLQAARDIVGRWRKPQARKPALPG